MSEPGSPSRKPLRRPEWTQEQEERFGKFIDEQIVQEEEMEDREEYYRINLARWVTESVARLQEDRQIPALDKETVDGIAGRVAWMLFMDHDEKSLVYRCFNYKSSREVMQEARQELRQIINQYIKQEIVRRRTLESRI